MASDNSNFHKKALITNPRSFARLIAEAAAIAAHALAIQSVDRTVVYINGGDRFPLQISMLPFLWTQFFR